MGGIIVYRTEDSCYVHLSFTNNKTFLATKQFMEGTEAYIVGVREHIPTRAVSNIDRTLQVTLSDINHSSLSLKRREQNSASVLYQ